MPNTFSRSWEITKLSFNVIKQDKELLLFPLLGGTFSILFLIAMVFPAIITGLIGGAKQNALGGALMLVIYFLVYLGLAFIATFFNVCVVYTTKIRFEGGNATFGESIKFAFSKIHLIFLWSLVSATVGLILRILDSIAERMGDIGRLIMNITTALLGAAWSLITIFVVPGMVYQNLTPFDAIKKSAETFKKTWGESLIRYYGLGLVELIFIVAGIALAFIAAFLSAPFGAIALISIVILAVVYLIAIISLFSVANSVFNTALYVYANNGKLPKGYSKEIMESAFTKKH